jgi:putative membrane protein insertion efficiency factor
MSSPLLLKVTSWPSNAAAALIRLYQMTISPALGGRCRFYPSCSEYSRQAFLKYGLFKGFYLTIWRLVKCNPLHPGGVDEP